MVLVQNRSDMWIQCRNVVAVASRSDKKSLDRKTFPETVGLISRLYGWNVP